MAFNCDMAQLLPQKQFYRTIWPYFKYLRLLIWNAIVMSISHIWALWYYEILYTIHVYWVWALSVICKKVMQYIATTTKLDFITAESEQRVRFSHFKQKYVSLIRKRKRPPYQTSECFQQHLRLQKQAKLHIGRTWLNTCKLHLMDW